MNNFYLIDKPIWITSFDILRDLRKKLWIKKMWHTWTLDPLATGLVLVAIGDYTKLIPFFEKDTKVYEFKVSLNWWTESYDLEKEIHFIDKELEEKLKNELTLEKLTEIIKKNFTWKITQTPPKYSALKIWWKKALELVREGIDFEMKKREVEIYEIEVLSYSYPEVFLRAKVSAWTYIRSIASDLWEIVWSSWYITYLRRVWIWNLFLNSSQELDKFDKNKFLDLEELFWREKFITLEEEIIAKMNNWLKVEINLEIMQWNYFIKNEDSVQNIVYYDWNFLIPIRKI